VKIRYRSGEAETIRLGAAGGHNGAGQFIATSNPVPPRPAGPTSAAGMRSGPCRRKTRTAMSSPVRR
jgi:hypothetical protein